MQSFSNFKSAHGRYCPSLIFSVALFLIHILSVGLAFSQTYTVQGTVKDATNNSPLIGASVLIKSTAIGGSTNLDGKFEFKTNQKSPFTLTISYLGYASQDFEVANADKSMVFVLKPDNKTLGIVNIVSERLSQKQKESALTVEAMDLKSIKETSASNFYEGLGQLKGVDLTSASIGFKIINTRGFNSTSPVRSLQLIDMVDNQSPGLNFSLGNFLGASDLDVLKVDLIVGASGAYYGPNAFNGVISMTTKDPFYSKGTSASVKVGERNLFEMAIRHAQSFRNKKGEEKFAYKFNIFYLKAYDWEADNLDPSNTSDNPQGSFRGWDAVNRYGDENLTQGINNAASRNQRIQFPGLDRWYRTGYMEKDLVDYNTKNFKGSAYLTYRIKEDLELAYGFNIGTGTTVYQGDNRYSLKDILFYQNKIELKKRDKFFVRAYTTHEDAGNSYDAVFTGFKMQDLSSTNNEWSKNYRNYWSINRLSQKVQALPGFPAYNPPFGGTADDFNRFFARYFKSADSTMAIFSDSLSVWHGQARNAADNVLGARPFLRKGTPEFDKEFNNIVSTDVNNGGTRFYDKSALYHIHAEYKFKPTFADVIVGGTYRLYTPNSQGTIFVDTAGRKITNSEVGFYGGAEKRLMDDKLKINLTARLDKNINFKPLFSPAISFVYNFDKINVFRFSFASAIRNPTLGDQYLYYNVGRAILLGNINGIEDLATVESLGDYFDSPNLDRSLIKYFDVPAIKPERVKTLELGYRTTLFEKLYLDASYYYSFYTNFIGYKVGVDIDLDTAINRITFAQPYRVAANSNDLVTTQGFSIGANYFYKFYALNANYSWNVLDRRGSTDGLIPAFNTPEHKYNIGVSGREIEGTVFGKKFRHLGFNINYKWIQGFIFEGSPQFTGFVPTYDMVDVQINKRFPKVYSTFKIGASNALNNKQIQVYGGPRIGRMAYFQITFDVDQR